MAQIQVNSWFFKHIITKSISLSLHCIVLYCIVMCCIVLYCIVLYFIVLYCSCLIKEQGEDNLYALEAELFTVFCSRISCKVKTKINWWYKTEKLNEKHFDFFPNCMPSSTLQAPILKLFIYVPGLCETWMTLDCARRKIDQRALVQLLYCSSKGACSEKRVTAVRLFLTCGLVKDL